MIRSFLAQLIIYLAVLAGILIMCLETYAEYKENHWKLFVLVDTICIFIYLIEFVIKIRTNKLAYFNNVWNLIDFFTLIISIIDCLASLLVANLSFKFVDLNNISNMFKLLKIMRIFRALKALRLLRTIKLLHSMKIILKTCAKSFRSLGAILALISLCLYNFSVIGCGLFFDLDEQRFGCFFKSMFTLFQVLTLDDWYSIYKINKIKLQQTQIQTEKLQIFKIKLDFLILFLIVYLIIEYFIMLNLFIAVLVDNFNLALKNSKYLQKNTIDKNEALQLENDPDSDSEIDSQDIDTLNQYARTLDPLIPSEQKEPINKHFQLLASIEYNSHKLRELYTILDYLVKMTKRDFEI